MGTKVSRLETSYLDSCEILSKYLDTIFSKLLISSQDPKPLARRRILEPEQGLCNLEERRTPGDYLARNSRSNFCPRFFVWNRCFHHLQKNSITLSFPL